MTSTAKTTLMMLLGIPCLLVIHLTRIPSIAEILGRDRKKSQSLLLRLTSENAPSTHSGEYGSYRARVRSSFWAARFVSPSYGYTRGSASYTFGKEIT